MKKNEEKNEKKIEKEKMFRKLTKSDSELF